MLYYETIPSETLELLKEIQQIEVFKTLRLVGGTALSLQIGHRTSVDLDLFGDLNCDKLTIINELNKIAKVQILTTTENINIYTVNNIKVDIVNYPYPWLYDEKLEDNLHLADIKDIAAMKLSAITGRGTKKDFIDLYFLLKEFKLEQLLAFYEQKYHDGSIFLVLKSLSYFENADEDVSPKMFITISWEDIKKEIIETVNNFVNK